MKYNLYVWTLITCAALCISGGCEPEEPKKNQTIQFAPSDTARVGERVTLQATASSGLTSFVYELGEFSQDKARMSGNQLTYIATGSVRVRAIQAGDKLYNRVESVWRTINVFVASSTEPLASSTKPQKIYFAPLI